MKRHRFIRRSLKVLAAFVLLAIAIRVVEDWRGQRALRRQVAALRALGEPVEIADLRPPAVPAEENFMEAAVIKEALAASAAGRLAEVATVFPGGSAHENATPPHQSPSWENFAEWRDFWEQAEILVFPEKSENVAADILAAWEAKAGTFFAEVEEAARRPFSQMAYTDAEITSLGEENDAMRDTYFKLRSLASVLALRARLALAAGQPETALRSVRALGALGHPHAPPPNLLFGLHQEGVTDLFRLIAYDACVHAGLSLSQWKQMRDELALIDEKEITLRMFRGEGMAFRARMAYMAENRKQAIAESRANLLKQQEKWDEINRSLGGPPP